MIVPQPVLEELRHPDAPKPVVEWADDLPEWVEVVATVQLNVDADLAELDAGEAPQSGWLRHIRMRCYCWMMLKAAMKLAVVIY